MPEHAGLSVSTGLLLAFVAMAAITDVRWRMIYNWTTYPGILAALAINAAGRLADSRGWATESTQRAVGWIGISASLLGLLICGFVLLVCVVFFKVGGGDLKLMAMIGAFVGPQEGIEILLWTFVLGAALAVILLIWRVGAGQLVARSWSRLSTAVRLRSWSTLVRTSREASSEDLQTKLYLAAPALVAVMVVRFQLLGSLKLM
ncbi:MAG: A24 family peptidase [Planctomycetia bacterium]|nr:A24 family peptidase [Planctomycetia bacterium]